MEIRDVEAALYKEAENVLEEFRDGSRAFMDYEFGAAIPHRLDFHEWISDLEDYLDVDPVELKGGKRFKTIKRYFAAIDDDRLRHLIENPKSITDDESLQWRGIWHQDDQNDADILVLVPLELASGERGAAIICCYSNIPGGEYDLSAVFSTVEEGESYLSRHCFDRCQFI